MSNIILDKSFEFAVDSIKLYKKLVSEKEFVLSNQYLRSSTSVGANVREAQQAQSKNDFISKINIALKEGQESLYWLELLYATDYIDKTEYESYYSKCLVINKILHSILKTSKNK